VLKGLRYLVQNQAADQLLEVAQSLQEGRAATQRDVRRLENWAIRSHMKFNRSRCRSCTWTGVALCTAQPGANWLGNSSAENALELLVDKLTMSQQCVLAAEKADKLLGCIRKSLASRCDPSPLYDTCETTRGGCVRFWSPHCKKNITMPSKSNAELPRWSGGWSTCGMRRS